MLVEDEIVKLQALLHYGSMFSELKPTEYCLIVTPRVGTISSWSSKATDIAHNCGLSKVNRIERGIAYYFNIERNLTEAELATLKDLLHDRMLETVLNHETEAALLFTQQEPKALTTIDILNGGRQAIRTGEYCLGLGVGR